MGSAPARRVPNGVLARVLAGVLAAGLAVTLTGCGSDDTGEAASQRASSAPTGTTDLWNPCDGLDRARVEQLLGVRVEEETGTSTAPRCTFTPKHKDDPALDVNYQLYEGTLTEMFATFGEAKATDVLTVEVPKADDARIVVNRSSRRTLVVSGFVQTGGLVQLVNALDPRPYDRDQLVRAVRALLADLADHAAGTPIASPGGGE